MPSLVRIHPAVWEENGDKQTNRQTGRPTHKTKTSYCHKSFQRCRNRLWTLKLKQDILRSTYMYGKISKKKRDCTCTTVGTNLQISAVLKNNIGCNKFDKALIQDLLNVIAHPVYACGGATAGSEHAAYSKACSTVAIHTATVVITLISSHTGAKHGVVRGSCALLLLQIIKI